MKKSVKLSISKKIFLLTASLSIALIIISITVSSVIFRARINNNAEALCLDSADNLGSYLSDYYFVVSANSSDESFVKYYKEKLDAHYRENVEEIEKKSAEPKTEQADLDDKKEFFDNVTSGIFKSAGFGMSYDLLSFRNTYTVIIEEMERMASVEGVSSCKLFYYDEENGNIVYMCDSTPETSFDYHFPASVEKPTDNFLNKIRNKDGASVVSQGDSFAGYAPVKVKGEILAYVTFEYSVDRLVNNERVFVFTLVSIMLLSTAVILFIYLFLSNRWLVKNVKKLSGAARTFTMRMGEGVIKPIDAGVKASDEIKELSDDFFTLQNKVASYSEDIARKRAEEERMHAELNIASKIQMQSLPDKSLKKDGVCISSFIKPAKEVGGDLFDYFVTGEGKLFFVIADVTGKGVPAALFMMRGKEIIRSSAKAGMSAAKIAAEANKELCLNNREGLFITAFIGIYDTQTKTLTYSRAGHEQPFLLRGGKAEQISEESNFVLGVFEDMPFTEESIVIEPGDRLLLFTDGLNEGINENKEEFGYGRIKEALENSSGDILAAMYDKAYGFANGTEQFDDITMLLFECVDCLEISLDNPEYKDIPAVTDKINAFVKGDKEKIAELDIIIDEVMNNCISYAYEGVKKPRLDIELKIFDGIAELSFTDNGALFDPMQNEDPDVDADIAERKEGGMGIMFVKTLSDKTTYRVYKGKNRLTVIKNLK